MPKHARTAQTRTHTHEACVVVALCHLIIRYRIKRREAQCQSTELAKLRLSRFAPRSQRTSPDTPVYSTGRTKRGVQRVVLVR